MKSTQVVFHCNLHEQIRKTFFNDTTLKYPEFAALIEQNKTLFLFNNMTLIFVKKNTGCHRKSLAKSFLRRGFAALGLWF